MQRVKRGTAVAVLPAPPTGGTAGYFAKPDPQGGVSATVPGYEWYNNVQEELMAVIEGQGLTASDTDRTQLRQAISKMIQAGQRAVIIGSSTFAPAVVGTGKAVYWDAANSRFDLALADGSEKQNCVGFADVPNGNVYAFGDAVLFAGLTPGSRYYLDSTTAGSITTTAPVNAIVVGIARNKTELFVDVDAVGLTQGIADTLYVQQSSVPAAGIGLPSGTPLWWLTPVAPIWALVRDGSAVSRTAYAKLFAALCPTRNATTTSGSATVTGLSTTADLYVGMPIEGAGIPAGTTVASITSASSITISANATASGAVSLRLFYYGYGNGGSATTFGIPDDRGLFERGLDTGARGYEATVLSGTTTSASNAVTGISSTKGLFIGQAVSGTGIPAGATITSIPSASSITISANATASGAVTITFTGGQIGNERADDFKKHNHIQGEVNNSMVGRYGQIDDTSITARYTANPGNGAGSNITSSTGGPETRPRFRSYLPIIVY